MFASSTAKLYLLPLYAKENGLGHEQIGLLFSAAAVASALFSLPAGMVVDRIGKTLVLCLSVGTMAASQVAMSLTTRFEFLLVWQFLGGFGISASMATLMATLADIVPSDRLGRSMGSLTFANQIGYLLGPALAAIALSWISLRMALAGSAVLACVALPMALSTRSPRSVTQQNQNMRRDLALLVQQPVLYSLVLALFAATLLWGTLEAYLPLLGKESMGLSNMEIGVMMSAQALVNGTSRIPSGRIIDHLRERRTLVVACTLAYAAVVASVPQLHGILAACVVSFSVALIATGFVALAASFAELATPSTKGTTMGVYVAVLYTGLAAGPAIFGSWIESKGFGVGFVLCCSVASILAVASYGLSYYEKGGNCQ
jgi:MFS family permease